MDQNKQNSHKSKTTRNTKKQKSRSQQNYYDNITPEDLENLCSRLLTLHKTGVYVPPPSKPYICKNKKRNKNGPRKYTEDTKKRKTTFGKGRVGVSCESFGIKNCACCGPRTQYKKIFDYFEKINTDLTDLNLLFDDNDDFFSINENSRTENDVILIDSSSSDSFITSVPSTSNYQNRIDDLVILDESSEIDNKNEAFSTNIELESNNIKSSTEMFLPEKHSDQNITVIKEEENPQTLVSITNNDEIGEKDLLQVKLENKMQENNSNKKTENDEDIMEYVKSITQDIDVDEELNKMIEFEKTFLEMIKSSPKRNENLAEPNINLLTSVPDIKVEKNDSVENNNQDIDTIINGTSTGNQNLNEKNNANEISLIPSTSKNTQENNCTILQKQQQIINTNQKNKTRSNELICLDEFPQHLDVIEINDIIEITDSPKPQSRISETPSKTNFQQISCPVCLDSFENKEIMSTICGHLFCSTCIKSVIRKTKKCPNCRKALTLKSIHPIYI